MTSPSADNAAPAGSSAPDKDSSDLTELVILTGMSGAGRSTAAKVLEDIAGMSWTTFRRS